MAKNPLAQMDEITLALTEADMEKFIAEADGPPRLPKIRRAPVQPKKLLPEYDELTITREQDDEATLVVLDDLDIGSYPRINAGHHNSSVEFCEIFLPRVKAEYDAKGWGSFECILVFPHNRVDDGTVHNFRRAVTSRISRLRAMKPGLKRFYVVHAHYEILPDRKHVAFRCIRMDEDHYQDWFRKERERNAKIKSIDRKLADLL